MSLIAINNIMCPRERQEVHLAPGFEVLAKSRQISMDGVLYEVTHQVRDRRGKVVAGAGRDVNGGPLVVSSELDPHPIRRNNLQTPRSLTTEDGLQLSVSSTIVDRRRGKILGWGAVVTNGPHEGNEFVLLNS